MWCNEPFYSLQSAFTCFHPELYSKKNFPKYFEKRYFFSEQTVKKNFPKTFFLNENKQTFEKKIVFLLKTNDFTERSFIEKTDEIDGK